MGKALWTNLSGGLKPNGWKGENSFTRPDSKRSAKAPRQSIKRKTRIKSISPKKKEINAEYAKRKRRYLKEHPICEACHKVAAKDLHHSRGRSGQLLIMAEFFQALCAPCHRWVHDNPKEAREKGLLALEGDWNRVPEIKPDLNNEGETENRR
jgi:hypothetical protein